ncbi:MAG: hypothetical protein H6830_01040 [Planctomycetes bacterium]|nr:hypothetical protein [Planctomycetota bacterium]MCB9911108.1 hypothetical protein [Planctomycetota bacterium]MCB9912159.1 hypothetical protein [Planctomycetota bacterium]HPF15791.1 hypothetical protein [Planctomycetota bacterium]HRV81381.1 hypothetical protein [Planctomycetota bacterium]
MKKELSNRSQARPASGQVFRTWRDPETGERMVVTAQGSPYFHGHRLEIPSSPSILVLASEMATQTTNPKATPASTPTRSHVQIANGRGILVG